MEEQVRAADPNIERCERELFHRATDTVAYESNEGGRSEIYVQSFPDRARKVQISTGGGAAPVWRGDDGRELYFRSPGGQLMAARIASNGTQLDSDTPSVLFALPAAPNDNGMWPFAASRDGQRFLVNTVVEGASPITVLLNWKPKK